MSIRRRGADQAKKKAALALLRKRASGDTEISIALIAHRVGLSDSGVRRLNKQLKEDSAAVQEEGFVVSSTGKRHRVRSRIQLDRGRSQYDTLCGKPMWDQGRKAKNVCRRCEKLSELR
jgi:hypothetical protein